MKKTLLVTLLLSLGPVAASAATTATGDRLPSSSLETSCALQPESCAVVERRAISF